MAMPPPSCPAKPSNVAQHRKARCRLGFTHAGAYRRLALAIVLPFTPLSPTPHGRRVSGPERALQSAA